MGIGGLGVADRPTAEVANVNLTATKLSFAPGTALAASNAGIADGRPH